MALFLRPLKAIHFFLHFSWLNGRFDIQYPLLQLPKSCCQFSVTVLRYLLTRLRAFSDMTSVLVFSLCVCPVEKQNIPVLILLEDDPPYQSCPRNDRRFNHLNGHGPCQEVNTWSGRSICHFKNGT